MKQQDQLVAALKLLGGPSVLGRLPQGPIEIHHLIADGLPVEALVHLLGSLTAIAPSDALGTVIAISGTAAKRHRKEGKRLNARQGESVWRFANLLAQASCVFGSQEEAERWLLTPAVGLDHHRPFDLMTTGLGAGVVARHLARIDYGIYA